MSSLEEVITDFEKIHLRRFGFMHPDGDIILDCVINKGIVENGTDDISHVSWSFDEVSPEKLKFWSNASVREVHLFYAECLHAEQF